MTPRALYSAGEGLKIWGVSSNKRPFNGISLLIFLPKSGGGRGSSPCSDGSQHMRELCSFVLFCYQTNLIENPGAPFQA